MSTQEPLPLRQLARLRGEMHLALRQAGADSFGVETVLSAEYALVARRCLPDWCMGDDLAAPVAPACTITVRQIALSLGSPAESTRRRVKVLIDRGLVVAGTTGMSLAATPGGAAFALHYLSVIHDHLLRLIEDVATTCDIAFPVGAERQWTRFDIVERAIDAILLAIDTYRLPGTLQRFEMWNALTAFAVRSVTYDPVLCRRYAVEIPPDDLRRALSVRRLAEVMAIPYTTAWRQMQALLDDGLVTRLGPDRWSVFAANLRRDSVSPLAGAPGATTLRRIRELALLGLDPHRAREFYLLGRPKLLDFGTEAPARLDARACPTSGAG